MSGCSHLRFSEGNLAAGGETVNRLINHFFKDNTNRHDFSVLYNGYTEQPLGAAINKYLKAK
jgi:hypothetical protein